MSPIIEERIIRIICLQLDMDMEEVTGASFLMDDLGADPYELEEISNLLSEEFDIKVTEDDIESWESVNNVIQFVMDKIAE